MITFTSASTAENFFAMAPELSDECQIASIGPITSQALEKLGHKPHLEVSQSTIPNFVDAIEQYFKA